MTEQANTNSPAPVRQGRTRTRFLPNGSVEQRVTKADNTRAWVPVNDRYRSRVSYGYDQPSGSYNARSVTR
ncbi:hypothetical protein AB0I89_24115 [Micromonospora sp. NPDC049801]|uniref:hypothetical protein n=1 Tax=unclassified Micromonospora TaxID=2617518 RepID=UPI0033CB8C3E